MVLLLLLMLLMLMLLLRVRGKANLRSDAADAGRRGKSRLPRCFAVFFFLPFFFFFFFFPVFPFFFFFPLFSLSLSSSVHFHPRDSCALSALFLRPFLFPSQRLGAWQLASYIAICAGARQACRGMGPAAAMGMALAYSRNYEVALGVHAVPSCREDLRSPTCRVPPSFTRIACARAVSCYSTYICAPVPRHGARTYITESVHEIASGKEAEAGGCAWLSVRARECQIVCGEWCVCARLHAGQWDEMCLLRLPGGSRCELDAVVVVVSGELSAPPRQWRRRSAS